MKFYIPNDRIDQINEEDCVWLNPAEFISHRRMLILYEYSNGWIFEADESFNSYFTLITGTQLPTITDQEYSQYILDKKAFFSKERAEQFRKAWINFLPKTKR